MPLSLWTGKSADFAVGCFATRSVIRNVSMSRAIRESSIDKPESHAEPRDALRSTSLDALNRRYLYSQPNSATRGLAERIRIRLRNWLLGDYLSAESEFLEHLVRHLNEIGSRLEESLVRLEDRRDGSLHALERRTALRADELVTEINRQAGELSRIRAESDRRLDTLESVATGMERILGSLSARTLPAVAPAAEAAADLPDYRYLLLENRFRGSEDEIERRLAFYPEIFAGAEYPVFELGAGRGELQRLFKRAGIASFSVEQDDAMVQRCAEQNLDVRKGDGIAFLETAADRSLGGFVAVQVVEHLPYPVLTRLLSVLSKKLAPGARIALETINSESLLALSRNYFRDPTHEAPLHPDTLRFLVETSGLRVVEVRPLSPYPDGAAFQELRHESFMTPRWKELLDVMNRNTRQLNQIFFGHQDYCLIADVPR